MRDGGCGARCRVSDAVKSETRLDFARAQHAPAAHGFDKTHEPGNHEQHREPQDAFVFRKQSCAEKDERHAAAYDPAAEIDVGSPETHKQEGSEEREDGELEKRDHASAVSCFEFGSHEAMKGKFSHTWDGSLPILSWFPGFQISTPTTFIMLAAFTDC